jgi:hypothetical protein
LTTDRTRRCRPFPRTANFSVRFLAKAWPLSGSPNYRFGSLADVLGLDERYSRQITTESCPRNQQCKGVQRCEPFVFYDCDQFVPKVSGTAASGRHNFSA